MSMDRRVPVNDPRVLGDVQQRLLRVEQRLCAAREAQREAAVNASGPRSWCHSVDISAPIALNPGSASHTEFDTSLAPPAYPMLATCTFGLRCTDGDGNGALTGAFYLNGLELGPLWVEGNEWVPVPWFVEEVHTYSVQCIIPDNIDGSPIVSIGFEWYNTQVDTTFEITHCSITAVELPNHQGQACCSFSRPAEG